MALFPQQRGIIVACDVTDVKLLRSLVASTCELSFISGYKIGMELALANGLTKVTKTIREITSKPIIYDHQKFGTDIPEICGGKVLDIIKKAGVNYLIVFPLSGVETLRATIEGCLSRGIKPIVGGEMTHKGYLKSEGGYLESRAPSRIYSDAASLGVEAFVVPGTRLGSIRRYRKALQAVIASPSFLFPGIGKGQGGDIVQAFEAVAPHNSYAIVGRGIYANPDPKSAALGLWSAVTTRFGG